MSTQEIRVSDLSGQTIQNPEEQRVAIVVTEHPNLDQNQRARLDAMPGELENIGRASIAAVGLEITFPGEEEPRRHILTKSNFDKLFGSGRAPDEIVAAAAVVEAVKQRTGTRTSHNTTKDGEPLVNYNDPANAGMPHQGRIGKREASYVRENLDLVNERRIAAGHPAIDPTNPADAERYGLTVPEQSTATPEQPAS